MTSPNLSSERGTAEPFKDIVIISILGGPGSGKGTQCRLLSHNFSVEHVSIGSMMRDEMNRLGSPYASAIREAQLKGTLGSKDVTIGILRHRMLEAVAKGSKVFALDGFPRAMDRVEHFERTVGKISVAILLQCDEGVMLDRLGCRGRYDDEDVTIKGRIDTFNHDTALVLEHFAARGILRKVDANRTVGDVQGDMQRYIKDFSPRKD